MIDAELDLARRDYSKARDKFRRACENAVRFSVGVNGSASRHGRDFWSCVIFTKLTLGAISVDKLAPVSKPRLPGDFWDAASVGSLCRTLAENVIVLQWLCGETKQDDLWKMRIALFQIIDNRARYRTLFEPDGHEESEEFLQAQFDLAKKLRAMPLFRQYPENQQREMLKGNKLPFNHDDVLISLGIDKSSFRKVYRYLSSYVHTGTISFFKNYELGRGNGEENLYDVQSFVLMMEFSALMLRKAIGVVKEIHETYK